MDNAIKTGIDNIRAFIQGCASVFDLTGGTYVFIPDLTSGLERDKTALKEDWTRVGNDIKRAMFIAANE